MTAHCACCGTRLPDDQGSRTCSACYGDPDHGRDGILRRLMEEDWLEQQERERGREREEER